MKKNYLSINQSINQSINNRSLGKKIFPILFITLLLIISSCILISCENPWMRELIEELEKKRDRDRERKNNEDNKEQVKVFTSVEDLSSWLLVQSNGIQTSDPVKFALKIPFGTMPDFNWYALLDTIDAAGKYVDIDLSGCSMSGTEFNPDHSVATGKNKIVSLVLPDNALSIIGSVGGGDFPFKNFDTLAKVSGLKITTIGFAAFINCPALTSVNFPSVTTIDAFAFQNCPLLKIVSFSVVTAIGDQVFQLCTALKSVSFPLLATISGNSFGDCTSLTDVYIPAATLIELYAFNGCTALQSVSFPLVATIESNAFSACTTLKSISLPVAATIEYSAFDGCLSLQSVNLPKATYIGRYAFRGCIALRTVDIPMIINICDTSGTLPLRRGVFDGTGPGNLTVTVGQTVPTTGISLFNNINEPKTVTVRIPSDSAVAYGAVPTDTTTPNWGNAFRGMGWDGATYLTGTVNGNITLVYQYY